MLEFFTSQLFLTILGAIWTVFKGTEWYGQLQDRKYGKFLEVLEIAVTRIYETYVRERKADPDIAEVGSLAEDERVEARSRAIDLAITLAKSRNINVAKLVNNREELEGLVQKIVQKVKEASK